MKKIWALITSSLLLASYTFAQDQTSTQLDNPQETYERSAPKEQKLGIGAKVAFDYGMMYGFNDDNLVDENPTGIGFEAGIMIRVQMIPNLYFVPEVNYAYIKTSHEVEHLERTYTSSNLEIPILFRGVIAEKFYVTAGPQVNIKLSDDTDFGSNGVFKQCIMTDADGKCTQYVEANLNDYGYTETLEQGKVDFGLAAGAGFNIFEGLFVDIRYYLGIKELYPDVESDDIMKGAKIMKFKAGISYWFI